MNDEVVKLLAERFLKKEDISDWAVKCLEKGFDSKTLRMLAATNSFDSPFHLDDYFNRILKELGWDKIAKRDCLMKYSKILAQNIVEDNVNLIKACRDIYHILVELDYPPELRGWNMIDELIWAYEHFITTGETSHFWKPKEELELDIKILAKELIESKEEV